MTGKNTKITFEGNKCDSLRINGHNRSNVMDYQRQENGYSTDDRAARCCSLKSVKSILSDAIYQKNDSKQILFTSKCTNSLSMNNTNNNNKSECMKNDEYMYDLAHFLFKISDLMLQVNDYEKKHSTKETDLKKMLNIVKTDIMKSFFKGKTKEMTMNKIVRRLTYLDKYIQQMNGNLSIKNENKCKKYDSSDISKNLNLKTNKKTLKSTKFSSKKNLKQLNSDLKSSNSGQKCNRCLDENKNGLNELDSKRFKRSTNKNTISENGRRSFDKKVRFNSSIDKNFTPATSNESFKSLPTSNQDNVKYKKVNESKLNPDNWVELDGNITTRKVPVNKVDKNSSPRKLVKTNVTEGNAQTDQVVTNEEFDHQIISMNVLYSKTHVKYIIPEWMDVDIDQSPKVLCKKDLDDGVALTSYKADQDGTIHFTLAYSSEDLCYMLNPDAANAKLISKLQEIRSIWAESARILYETLRKEFDEQNALTQEVENRQLESSPNNNNQTTNNQTVSNHTNNNQTVSNHTNNNHTVSNQTNNNHTVSNQTNNNQTNNHTVTNQANNNQTVSNHTDTNQTNNNHTDINQTNNSQTNSNEKNSNQTIANQTVLANQALIIEPDSATVTSKESSTSNNQMSLDSF
ncbi:hypothetical protein O3M35_012380 [Rhynocoris fuscipes]|uniref:Uncharacterized protein n=1 Tax=Rhynocoris fuscipes TaxID=488301 RepID=A0AAW1CVP7_9HEMI